MLISVTMGEAIALARAAKGWSQDQLADAVAIDQPTVSRWERNLQPVSLEQVRKIEDATQRPRGFLLRAAGYIDEPQTVREWLASDTALNEGFRKLLLGVYDDSVAESAAERAKRPPAKSRARQS